MTDDQRAYYVEWMRQLMFEFMEPIRSLICDDGVLAAGLEFGLDDLDDALQTLEQAIGRLGDIATCAQAETTFQ